MSLSDGADYNPYISYNSVSGNFVMTIANRPAIATRTTTLSITVQYIAYPNTSITASMNILEVDCTFNPPSVADMILFANDPASATVTKAFTDFASPSYGLPS